MMKTLASQHNPPLVDGTMSNLTSSPAIAKQKRNSPGNPDPDAEVVALSPKTLSTTNRFMCEICNKGFQRNQNLQMHRRGHNLPWTRSSKEVKKIKKVYVCPEESCVHHHPTRALGDLTGIKKHFFRKHGEKKWECEKCSKKYALQSDWKAHFKTCGTKDYTCDCGTPFSRRDSFIAHRAFCDALAEESARTIIARSQILQSQFTTNYEFPFPIKKEPMPDQTPPWLSACPGPPPPPLVFQNPNPSNSLGPTTTHNPPPPQPPHISATALLQKAAVIGAKSSTSSPAGDFTSLNWEWNKAGGSMVTAGEISHPPLPSNSLLLDDLIVDAGAGFDGTAFGNMGILHNDGQSFNFYSDDTTRDFLGLRPLSQFNQFFAK